MSLPPNSATWAKPYSDESGNEYAVSLESDGSLALMCHGESITVPGHAVMSFFRFVEAAAAMWQLGNK